MKKVSLALVIAFIFLILSSCGIFSIDLPESLFLIRAKYEKPFTFIRSGESASRHARTEDSLYLPWNDSLYIVGKVDKGIYSKGDSIPLNFSIGLNDRVLADGDLRIMIFTDDFTANISDQPLQDNTYIIKDFFSEDGNVDDTTDFTISLSPDYSDIWAAGEIHISVQYVPHDMQSFMDEMGAYLESSYGLVGDDCIYLVGSAIAYAADPLEIWMKYGSYGDVFNDITKYHYEKEMITREEMAECCFEYQQMDKVNSYVFNYDEDTHVMNIGYFSKNIRYIGEQDITDTELEKAILAHETFWKENHYMPAKGGLSVALRILEIMHERGIITDAEYLAELSLIENAKGVYANFSESNASFPYTKYQEVNALRETHHD